MRQARRMQVHQRLTYSHAPCAGAQVSAEDIYYGALAFAAVFRCVEMKNVDLEEIKRRKATGSFVLFRKIDLGNRVSTMLPGGDRPSNMELGAFNTYSMSHRLCSCLPYHQKHDNSRGREKHTSYLQLSRP
jgi:hypothetical protein